MRKVLLVGDSRVSGFLWSNETWEAQVEDVIGGYMSELIEKTNLLIDDETEIVVLVGVHCDLTYRDIHENSGYRGLMVMHRNPPLDELVTQISTWDYQFRKTRNVSAVWVLPALPDFEEYNRIKAYDLGEKYFCDIHVQQAKRSREIMAEALLKMKNMLQVQGVHLLDLQVIQKSIPDLKWRDGLHWKMGSKKRVLDTVIEASIGLHPMTPPVDVGKMKSAEARVGILRRKKTKDYRRLVRDKVEETMNCKAVEDAAPKPQVRSIIQPIQNNNPKGSGCGKFAKPGKAGNPHLQHEFANPGGSGCGRFAKPGKAGNPYQHGSRQDYASSKLLEAGNTRPMKAGQARHHGSRQRYWSSKQPEAGDSRPRRAGHITAPTESHNNSSKDRGHVKSRLQFS